MNAKKLSSFALAATAASMFAMAVPTTASAGEDKIHCYGVNSCKGTSSCKTANSACKGQNSCKATGFVSVTNDVCTQLGGTVGD